MRIAILCESRLSNFGRPVYDIVMKNSERALPATQLECEAPVEPLSRCVDLLRSTAEAPPFHQQIVNR